MIPFCNKSAENAPAYQTSGHFQIRGRTMSAPTDVNGLSQSRAREAASSFFVYSCRG